MSEQTVNPIDAAIAKAKEQAAQSAGQPAIDAHKLPATAQGGSSVAAYAPAKALTMDDLSGGMNVDNYLKVKDSGLTVGTSTDFFDSFRAVVDTSKIQVFESIRFGKPNPSYLKTYDMQTCTSGGTWAAALERAHKVEPEARPYKGIDIIMQPLEDIKGLRGAELAKRGEKLGHSTSVTNRGHAQDFRDALVKAGLLGQKVEVEVGYEAKVKGSNKWGVVTFKLIGPSTEEFIDETE